MHAEDDFQNDNTYDFGGKNTSKFDSDGRADIPVDCKNMHATYLA